MPQLTAQLNMSRSSATGYINRFAVNAGFVRLYDAAWSGDDPGPAADSGREPAEISLAQVAEADVFNATSCRAWRELALGLREHYQRLQSVTNTSCVDGIQMCG